jgi:hypothetical protein
MKADQLSIGPKVSHQLTASLRFSGFTWIEFTSSLPCEFGHS